MKQSFPDKIFIHRVDGPVWLHSKGSKYRDKITHWANKNIADATVFQSDWSRNENCKLGFPKSSAEKVIINAALPLLFNRLGKQAFDPTRKTKVIITSWSSNKAKGFDVYSWLDQHLDFSKLELTFVGNSPVSFQNIQQVAPLPPQALAPILKEHDIYLTASEKDACSNALIEGLSCGLPAIAKNDGGHPEIVKDGGELFDSPEQIPFLLEKLIKEYAQYQDRISIPSMEETGNHYLRFITKVFNQSSIKPKRLKKSALLQFAGISLANRLHSLMAKMKKYVRILLINMLLLLIGLMGVELIFGGWFSQENKLNSLFVVRDRVTEFELNGLYPYHKPTIKITKDRYGFRGGASTYNNPAAIDILCIGGSTTQQTYVEDGYTWPDVLEKELKKNGLDLNVANAGIDGQSTFGHIKNFELWFSQVPDLNPDYIFFYVGINDFHRSRALAGSDEIMRNDFSSKVIGSIKNNGAIYRLFRYIYGMIEASRSELTHGKVVFKDHDYVKNGLLPESIAKEILTAGLGAYEQRLRKLVMYSEEIGATPVFITQPSRRFKFNEKGEVLGLSSPFKKKLSGYKFNGVDYYEGMLEMNEIVKNVADSYKLLVIDQTGLDFLTDEHFYDFTHTTPLGSKLIGKHIASVFMESLGKHYEVPLRP
ncbi:MAG: GDSL-type esterase/lipase family protein [Cytophagales bacterium]|nr:GDSL-type esterase/lipase family protein [Cytophagales bacterium]